MECGDAAALGALLERGDDVDSRDRYGQTDLEGSGAPGFAGKTAFDLAIDLGTEDIADLLNSEDV